MNETFSGFDLVEGLLKTKGTRLVHHLGAERRHYPADIRVQFLMEATVLTCTGGAIGITLGAIIAFVVRTLMPNIPATLSLLWVVLGVGMSIAVGVFFGYYPANRAANLDPIVALRYE